MKKRFLLQGLITGLFLWSFLWSVYPASADGPPPGGGGGRGCGDKPPQQPCPPIAQLGLRNSATALSPDLLVAGQPMTYTLDISNAGDKNQLDAINAVFELPFVGDQQFVSFNSTNPDWKLRQPAVSPNTNTLYVDMGTVKPGQSGIITIHAIFATNYDRTVYDNTVYFNWTDSYGDRRKGVNLIAQVAVAPPSGPQPIPDPPRSQPTPGPTSPGGSAKSGPFAPVANPGKPNSDAGWFFPATGHTLHGQFLSYWQSHGSLIVLGFPLSEEHSDNGRIIQYFERAVLEFWPENQPPYNVLLRSLGRELSQVDPAVPSSTPAPSVGSVFYNETGHWLDGRFVAAWRSGGGLAQYGFPIQEPKRVGDKLVQWTERARFELDLSRPNQLVMLGLLGDESAQRKGKL